MKIFVVVAIVVSFFAGVSYRLLEVKAQSIGASPSSTTQLSGCPSPAANLMNFCQVTGDPLNPAGVYLTSNGAPYFLLQPVGGSGVQSFNTRSGKVTAAIGDYSFAMVGGTLSPSQIPTHTCTMTTAAGTNAAVVTLSGCK